MLLSCREIEIPMQMGRKYVALFRGISFPRVFHLIQNRPLRETTTNWKLTSPFWNPYKTVQKRRPEMLENNSKSWNPGIEGVKMGFRKSWYVANGRSVKPIDMGRFPSIAVGLSGEGCRWMNGDLEAGRRPKGRWSPQDSVRSLFRLGIFSKLIRLFKAHLYGQGSHLVSWSPKKKRLLMINVG